MARKAATTIDAVPICTPVSLPPASQTAAALQAVEVNPANAPPVTSAVILSATALMMPVPDYLAVLTTKYWGAKGVQLTVGFVEAVESALRDKILLHMNAWGEFANVKFTWTQTDAQVRITRQQQGYWSYLGTDILSIPRGRPTMCLQGFTARTAESEFTRVVRHETGHTCGFPHEHMRRELIARLDRQKTIDYFQRTQGWSEQMTVQQVLTPLEESSLIGTEHADADSIMCYQLPASITADGQSIRGGADIGALDRTLAAKVYPKAPPPPPTGKRLVIEFDGGYRIVEG